jgi:hypothetical protein
VADARIGNEALTPKGALEKDIASRAHDDVQRSTGQQRASGWSNEKFVQGLNSAVTVVPKLLG